MSPSSTCPSSVVLSPYGAQVCGSRLLPVRGGRPDRRGAPLQSRRERAHRHARTRQRCGCRSGPLMSHTEQNRIIISPHIYLSWQSTRVFKHLIQCSSDHSESNDLFLGCHSGTKYSSHTTNCNFWKRQVTLLHPQWLLSHSTVPFSNVQCLCCSAEPDGALSGQHSGAREQRPLALVHIRRLRTSQH